MMLRAILFTVLPSFFLNAQPPPLPGKGLSQHPFLYCGEWQNRSLTGQTMHIVRGGKIVWSYTNPLRGEYGDCSMLSNGRWCLVKGRFSAPMISQTLTARMCQCRQVRLSST